MIEGRRDFDFNGMRAAVKKPFVCKFAGLNKLEIYHPGRLLTLTITYDPKRNRYLLWSKTSYLTNNIEATIENEQLPPLLHLIGIG